LTVVETADASFSLRPMRLEDIPDGLRLCRACGWNQREEDWRALLSLSPGGFVAAVGDGRVVGTGGALRYGGGLGWACMILVDPESRGRGLGTRIMEEVLRGLADVPVVGLDATPGGRLVYVKLGFRDGRPLARFDARPLSALPPPRSAVRRMTAADLLEVLAWDREAFGADRAGVLRWALAQAPEYAWCARADGGGVEGYCCGRRGHDADHIGPVVARRPEIARDLVQACRATQPGRRFFVDAPREPAEWPRALAELGFAEQRPFTRMYRGEGREPGRPAELYAVVGPEFG
jgi:GNAT superfamily N-acetyltransferase